MSDIVKPNSKCNTTYPIMLIHGAGFRDDCKLYNYWGRIPKALQREGASVFYSRQDAWGTIEHNASIVKEEIIKVLSLTNAKKINLVAHSRGGLEARYLIHELNMNNCIASLTTISTPHHGSKSMDIFYRFPKFLYRFVSYLINLLFKLLGDKKPDFYISSRQLSSIECKKFNEKHKNCPHIYYQSYAAKMKYSISDPLFMLTHFIIKIIEGNNDGLCTVESAKWGNFRGIISAKNCFGISHAGVIDAYRCNFSGTDLPEKYIEIVEDLKKRNL